MANDWYTRTTWSEADQADFFARLKRSRTSYHKAQYLHIQARELVKVGLLKEALTLMDKMLAEYPEPFYLAQVLSQKAGSLAKLGDLEQAIVYYRRAFDVERQPRSHRALTLYEFGIFVVENKLTQLYDEALAVLDEMKLPGTQFPSDIYKSNGIRAIITAHKGETKSAGEFAQVALEAASKENSGFSHHPKFGLVKDQESKFYETIEAIATKHIHSFSN